MEADKSIITDEANVSGECQNTRTAVHHRKLVGNGDGRCIGRDYAAEKRTIKRKSMISVTHYATNFNCVQKSFN